MGAPSYRIIDQDGSIVKDYNIVPRTVSLEPGQQFSFFQRLDRYMGGAGPEVRYAYGSVDGFAVGDHLHGRDTIIIRAQGDNLTEVLMVATKLKDHLGAIDITPKVFNLPELEDARQRVAYLWRWLRTGKTES